MKASDVRTVASWLSVLLLAAGIWLGLQDRITSGGLSFAVGAFLLTFSQYDPGPYLRGRW